MRVGDINQSGAFNSMKQILKISPEIISTIPKAVITTALIAPAFHFLFSKKDNNKKGNVSFTGAQKLVSNVMNNQKFQNFVIRNQNRNFVQSSLFFKDILATSLFAGFTMMNPKIKKEDKKPLINNSVISTGLTLLGAYGIDKLTQRPVEKMMCKLFKANKNSPNLEKYLNGLKVIKPIIILSGLYYIAVPVLSTFLAGKINKNESKVK